MSIVTVKTSSPQLSPEKLIATAQAKASDILHRTDRVLVVYEKDSASLYYERKAKA
jgi:hypothetical protein